MEIYQSAIGYSILTYIFTVVYGNEAQMTYTYGMPVLLARVKPYAERTKEAGNINTTPGLQKVSIGASDPSKSSQPGDDAKPSAPKA